MKHTYIVYFLQTPFQSFSIFSLNELRDYRDESGFVFFAFHFSLFHCRIAFRETSFTFYLLFRHISAMSFRDVSSSLISRHWHNTEFSPFSHFRRRLFDHSLTFDYAEAFIIFSRWIYGDRITPLVTLHYAAEIRYFLHWYWWQRYWIFSEVAVTFNSWAMNDRDIFCLFIFFAFHIFACWWCHLVAFTMPSREYLHWEKPPSPPKFSLRFIAVFMLSTAKMFVEILWPIFDFRRHYFLPFNMLLHIFFDAFRAFICCYRFSSSIWYFFTTPLAAAIIFWIT